MEDILDGSPLTAELPNTNVVHKITQLQSLSHDQDMPILLPGQNGETRIKQTGGGHFSARLTAPLCIAGGIALQILRAQGITIAAHVLKIKKHKRYSS